jgi:heme/copper-type cytochrome/quinol oxidase subunit 2
MIINRLGREFRGTFAFSVVAWSFSKRAEEGTQMMNMSGGSKEQRLAFLRRMIWWMPILAFAIVTSVIFLYQTIASATVNRTFDGAIVSGLVAGLLWGLGAAVIVGIIVVVAYMGYKMMLDRQPA